MIIRKTVWWVMGVLFVFSSLIVNAHDSHRHSAPWKVCENKKLVDPCEYTNGKKDLYKGTCQAFNGSLMCVRNKPIIHSVLSDQKVEKVSLKWLL